MKVSAASILSFALAIAPAFAVPVSEFDAKVAQGLRLVSTSVDKEPTWVTEDYKIDLLRKKIGFFDVTDTYHVDKELAAKKTSESSAAKVTYPAISHQTQVKALINTLSISNMQSSLATLTAFNNRYYKSTTGASASDWIYKQLVSIKGSRTDITVTQFTHSFVQKSVIARFDATGAATILGAHLDSINLNSPTAGRAPGADDDGSGTVNLIEVFRALVASGFKPTAPVEFHFNAGEEGGLLGSQGIASSYKSAAKSVKAYVQFDMTAYLAPGSKEGITLVTDNVDTSLTTYIRNIVTTYLAIPLNADWKCGYGCSDHASWTKQGYPSAFPFESTEQYENPYIHSTGDTTSVSGFSWTHSLEYAKIALAVAYELGV